jgi:hypothetical protein
MKRIALVASMLALLLGVLLIPAPTLAQDGGQLEYGQTVQGELTAAVFEVSYTFNGTAGDVVVVEMSRFDFDSNIDEPALRLTDANGTILGTDEGFGSTRVAAVLPVDGAYTVVATRTDGAAGESLGLYALTLHRAIVLQPGELLVDTVTSEEIDYFAIQTAGQVTLNYRRTGGEFNPAVTAYRLDQGELLDVVSLDGERLRGGNVVIEVLSGETLVVDIAESLFDFNFDPVTADYEIGLNAAGAPPPPPPADDAAPTEAPLDPSPTAAPPTESPEQSTEAADGGLTDMVGGVANLPQMFTAEYEGVPLTLNLPADWVTEVDAADGIYVGTSAAYITAFRNAPPGVPVAEPGTGINLIVGNLADLPVGDASAAYDLFRGLLESPELTVGDPQPFTATNYPDAVVGELVAAGQTGQLYVLNDSTTVVIAIALGDNLDLAGLVVASASSP